jgi:hypothetical protein
MATTDPRLLGDLDLARTMLAHEDFLEGHVSMDADELLEEVPNSEPGVVTVHLNGSIVEALLAARGWKYEARYPATSRAWTAPDGERVWGRDEALTVALTAEVV